MRCLLIYYTGTYNTRYLTELLKSRLTDAGIYTESFEIDPSDIRQIDLSGWDIYGLGYPIYGFNAPMAFVRFIRRQKFPADSRVFIYKNSGETYSVNDASSISLLKHIRRCKASVQNEYHFMMPYNIHFRFEEKLIREMLMMDDKLMDILLYEVLNKRPNIRKYSLLHRMITAVVKLQYIGGPVNSFFYRANQNKCSGCGLCIKNCPTHNIYKDAKGRIKFHHNCLMCMRCSMFCPSSAINIGLLQSWKVNGGYDLKKISAMELPFPVITPDTEGFFRCYVKTYREIEYRHKEIFDKNEEEKIIKSGG